MCRSRNKLLSPLLFLALSVFGVACKVQVPNITQVPKTGYSEYIVLTHLTLIDGTGNKAVKNSTIEIQNGLITNIYVGEPNNIPKTAQIFDLHGKYAIPGLIDGHVHLTSDETTKDGMEFLQKQFANGVTSVRDMAGNGTALKAIQEWASNSAIPACKVYFSAIVAGPEFLANDPRVPSAAGNSIAGEVSWMPKLDETTDIEALVSEAKSFGVTAIKLYADIPSELAIAVIEEAHAQDIQAWAHCTLYPAEPKDLVFANIDAISHADMLHSVTDTVIPDWYEEDSEYDIDSIFTQTMTEFLTEMAMKNIVLDATLLVADRNPYANAVTKRAHDLGVLIGAGTDFYGDFPLLEELKLLIQEAHLTPNEAIQAATMNNAIALGIEESYGSIEVHKVGNIVILNANPLDNIDNLGQIMYVIKEGQLFENDSNND